MHEHVNWLTGLFNEYLNAPANSVRDWVGSPANNPARPWADFVVMEVLVFLLMLVFFAWLKTRLSATAPGTTQQFFESIYEFLHEQVEDNVGRHGHRYLYFFGTVFLFVLFANMLGIIPAFEAPTMFPAVPLGIALCVFAYYHVQGLKAVGPKDYALQFTGRNIYMVPLMLPIEIISHLARLLSLTARLYANMFAGEQVTLVFIALTYLGGTIFMGMHVAVGFLQAYVFALMAMVYVGGATSHEH